jgi:hypothetical protein
MFSLQKIRDKGRTDCLEVREGGGRKRGWKGEGRNDSNKKERKRKLTVLDYNMNLFNHFISNSKL